MTQPEEKHDFERVNEGGYSRVYEFKKDKRSMIFKRNIKDSTLWGMGCAKEISTLIRLSDSPAVVHLRTISYKIKSKKCMSPINNRTLCDDDAHLVFDKADNNLRDYLHENLKKVGTPEYYSTVKRFMVQIMLGMEHMHKGGFMHRDMKPENVLISLENGVPDAIIADFGMAEPYCRFPNPKTDIFSSWYRPPEVCFHDPMYGIPCDVWSVGIILAEMVSGRNLLQEVGDDNAEIMRHYMRYIPVAEEKKDLEKLVARGPSKLSLKPGPKANKSMVDFLGLSGDRGRAFEKGAGSVKEFVDLLSKMLRYDDSARISMSQALSHSFFEEYQEKVIPIYRKGCEFFIPSYQIKEGFERRVAGKCAQAVFKDKKYLSWYSHRILFQGLSLFDRTLEWKMNEADLENKVESEERGVLWKEEEAKMYFLFCLYIAYKYFFIDGKAISLSAMADNLEIEVKEEVSFFQLFERALLRNQNLDLYRETCFEFYCNHGKFEEAKVPALLKAYLGAKAGILDVQKVVAAM